MKQKYLFKDHSIKNNIIIMKILKIYINTIKNLKYYSNFFSMIKYKSKINKTNKTNKINIKYIN
jgi:hypothetical protein